MRVTPEKTLLLGSAFILLSALQALAASMPDSAHYRRCLADSSANPAIALTDAESWARASGGVPAQHCAALALVSLKRYAEAGDRLDKLAADRGVPDISFRVSLYDQAGNAWLLAGDGARAIQSFSAALSLSAGDPDLFADLARAHAMRKNWHEVDLDLNAALQLSPRRAPRVRHRPARSEPMKREMRRRYCRWRSSHCAEIGRVRCA